MNRTARIFARVMLGGAVALAALSAGVTHAAYTIEQIPGANEVIGDFVVGPTKVELSIEPGQERQIELMVTNRMGERRVFNFEIEDARGSTDPTETVVLLGDDRGPYSLKDYIKIPELSFELEQGERARIPVTVSIPQDAQPGGLYGSVLVTTTSIPGKGEGDGGGAKAGSVIVSRIGALFFVTVPGDVLREGALSKFTTIPAKKFFTGGPIRFQVLFENSGSVHLNPAGEISIKNILGEEVGVVKAEPWFALPQSVRLRELSWNRPYLFGYYTAELTLDRGYDHLTDTANVSFFVIPWMLLTLALVVLTVLVFLLRLLFRALGKFEIKRK